MTVDSVSQAGQVFVLYLASDGSVLSHVALNGNSGGTSGVLIPPTAASFFGKSVAPAGDLNHDGHIDLVVGASPSDSVNRGMVRTILLDASPAPMITNLQINDGDIGRTL